MCPQTKSTVVTLGLNLSSTQKNPMFFITVPTSINFMMRHRAARCFQVTLDVTAYRYTRGPFSNIHLHKRSFGGISLNTTVWRGKENHEAGRWRLRWPRTLVTNKTFFFISLNKTCLFKLDRSIFRL